MACVLGKASIDRNRLAYLRPKPNAAISLKEAKALALIFKMTIDQLAEELEEVAAYVLEQAKQTNNNG